MIDQTRIFRNVPVLPVDNPLHDRSPRYNVSASRRDRDFFHERSDPVVKKKIDEYEKVLTPTHSLFILFFNESAAPLSHRSERVYDGGAVSFFSEASRIRRDDPLLRQRVFFAL